MVHGRSLGAAGIAVLRRALHAFVHSVTRQLWLLVALGLPGWLLLGWWYSLPANLDRTHFALEKVPGGFDSPVLRATLLILLLLSGIYFAGYRLLARQPAIPRPAKAAVALLVLGPMLVNLFLYPVGALDAFNYLVELKLTYGYGENPYLVTFAAYPDDPFALPAFLVDVPLFYGPVWLLAYGLPAAVVGFGSIVTLLGAVKLFNLVLLLLTGVVILRASPGHREWLGVYLFLANPLVVFEVIGNAHNDVLMTLLLVCALAAFARKSVAAGPLLALSTLVKFFVAPLAPVLLVAAIRDRWGWRRIALAGALSVLVVVPVVAPYWADGAMLEGLREGTAKSQQMDHVSLLSLAQQAARTRSGGAWFTTIPLAGGGCVSRAKASDSRQTSSGAASPCRRRWPPVAARKAFVSRVAQIAFAVLALVVLVAVAKGRAPDQAAVDMLLLFFLLMTNFYSWYLIPVFALLAMRRERLGLRYLFAATALGLAYYPAYVFARFNTGWTELSIHLFLALFLTVPALLFLGAEGWRFLSRHCSLDFARPLSRWLRLGLQGWRAETT